MADGSKPLDGASERRARVDRGLSEGVVALVAGAGHFGARACRELRARHPHWRIVVADSDPSRLEPLVSENTEVRRADAVELLEEFLEKESLRWVIPAVPFHLVHAWLMRVLSRGKEVKRASLPPDLGVPNPIPGAQGDLYTSYATFRCPEHCSEPRGRCTVTGERRPVALFELLKHLRVGTHTVVGIRSYQLAPGVGGLRRGDLVGLLQKAREAMGPLIVFTACRCHGVLSGLELEGTF